MHCFEAAMKWQRHQLWQQLLASLTPKPPLLRFAWESSFTIKYIYVIALIALLPLLVTWWLLCCCVQLLQYPYHYIMSFLKPHDLKGPGERNLQGVHNAFASHMDLSTANYVHCVNDWIAILYGKEAAKNYRMDRLVDIKKMEQAALASHSLPNQQLRNTLSLARETLAKTLGHY